MNRFLSPVCMTLSLAVFLFGESIACGGDTLNANDISFLWPLPTDSNAAALLISADEALTNGSSIWPQADFDQMMSIARSTAVVDGQPIVFPANEGIDTLHSWKIAGIRIDPSAPGCHSSIQAAFGETPQIRLVVQPIRLETGSKFRIHDIAAHLGFDFSTTPGNADRVKFKAIVDELVAIKHAIQAQGVATDEKLGVHPGFANPSVDLTGKLRAFLQRHLPHGRLNTIAFMGIRRPEPWIFFVANRNAAGDFEPLPLRTANGSTAIQFLQTDPQKVRPAPTNSQFGTFGVSTMELMTALNLEAEAGLSPVSQLGRKLKVREIPDVIANPVLSHVFNTDCISCHTESSLRSERALPPAGAPLAAEGPGSRPEALPGDVWNIRNFGWGIGSGNGEKRATATLRVANEATESAEYINRVYLSPPQATGTAPPTAAGAITEPEGVSHALTLVMKADGPIKYAALKAKITQLQAGPPATNPIRIALEKLEKVHFARFVFIDESETVMVITTFDDDFDAYLDLFVDNIGDVFDLILSHVKDAPPLPVSDHREEFNEFVRKHDVPAVGGLYSAYPKLRATDIRRQAEESTD